MGTNYYYQTVGTDPCPHCGRGDNGEELHIGKSSVGWAFSLHIIPERRINTLEDWQKLWASGGRIFDEYGQSFTPEEMLEKITQRKLPLKRHGGSPVLAGEPTYDLAPYEFS